MEHIKIGPIYYRLVEVEKLNDGKQDLCGEIDYEKCTVTIQAGLVPQFRQVLLWHEVIHGLLTHAAIKHNEQLVDVLAYGVVQVVIDNPKLMEETHWLKGLTLTPKPGEVE